MPYYCTVPRCTSMAGKAKNVSFHQFPRDEELANLWNCILKRGKPYTKYSKVCSLHFKLEDYTITSVGKNKGQWRTLRKDAVPSQNLPSDSPVPQQRRHSVAWTPSLSPGLGDPMVQQQMAQAIYMQTMLAMQAASAAEPASSSDTPSQSQPTMPSPSATFFNEIDDPQCAPDTEHRENYQCQECSKCFKDPDVFLIHKRTHTRETHTEKENYSANIQDRDETLRANPILANLLKSTMRLEPESNLFDASVLTVENQIMAALASNMEAYIRTLSSMLATQKSSTEDEAKCIDEDKCSGEGSVNSDVNDSNDSDLKCNGDESGDNCKSDRESYEDRNVSDDFENHVDRVDPDCDSNVGQLVTNDDSH